MSKGLEALDRIKDNLAEFVSDYYHYGDYVNDINSIEKELKEGEKNKQALGIIARMGLGVGWFQRMLKEGMTYEEYNFSNPTGKYHLTEENFNLLKEVLL